MAFSPVFFIGFGGTGTRIVTRIKRILRERAAQPGSLKWDDLEKIVRFYGIDTRTPDAGVNLLRREFQTLAGRYGGVKGSAMVDALLRDPPQRYQEYFAESWPWGPGNHDRPGYEFTQGAGANRRYGRLCLDYSILREGKIPLVDDIKQYLTNLAQVTVAKQQIDAKDATIVVFGSLCGGTASGINLDLVQALRAQVGGAGFLRSILGVFVLPSIFEVDARSDVNIRANLPAIRRNYRAAMEELLYYASEPYHRVWPLERAEVIDGPTRPFDVIFQVGPDHPRSPLTGLDDAIDLCAQVFATMYTSEAAAQHASNLINQVVQAGGGTAPVTLFGRLGHRRQRLGVERIEQYIYHHLAKETLEAMLASPPGTDDLLSQFLTVLRGGDADEAVDLDQLSEQETWLTEADRSTTLCPSLSGLDEDGFRTQVRNALKTASDEQEKLEKRLQKSRRRRFTRCQALLRDHVVNALGEGPGGFARAVRLVADVTAVVVRERGEVAELVQRKEGEIKGKQTTFDQVMEQWCASYKGWFGTSLANHPEEAHNAAETWCRTLWLAICALEEAEANRDLLDGLAVELSALSQIFTQVETALRRLHGRQTEEIQGVFEGRGDLFTDYFPRSENELRLCFGEQIARLTTPDSRDLLYRCWLDGTVDGAKVSTRPTAHPSRGLRHRIEGCLVAGTSADHVADGLEEDLAAIGIACADAAIMPELTGLTLLGAQARKAAAEAGSDPARRTAQDCFSDWFHDQIERARAYGDPLAGETHGGAYTVYANLEMLGEVATVLGFDDQQAAAVGLAGYCSGGWKLQHADHKGAHQELVFHRMDTDIAKGAKAFADYANADPAILERPENFIDRRFPEWLRRRDTSHLREATLLGLAAEWQGVIEGTKGAAMAARKSPGTDYRFGIHLDVKGRRVDESRAVCYSQLVASKNGELEALRQALRGPLNAVAPGQRADYWQQIKEHLEGWHRRTRNDELQALLADQILHVEQVLGDERELNRFFESMAHG